jgi:UDP:flavonoid glycosyltransferase YjiC (YdhE family)
MPRILIVSQPFYGHISPLLAIARELLNRKYKVIWCTDVEFENIGRLLYSNGIEVFDHPSFRCHLTPHQRQWLHGLGGHTDFWHFASGLIEMRQSLYKQIRLNTPGSKWIRKQVRALVDIIRQCDPEVILTEACNSVPVAAKSMDISWVYVPISSLTLPEIIASPPPEFFGLSSHHSILYMIARSIWKMLKPFRSMGRIESPFLNIIASSPELEGIIVTKTTWQFVGPLMVSGQTSLPSIKWLDDIHDKPLVYITLGTSVRHPAFLANIIEAFGPLDLEVVISLGNQHNPMELPPTPRNIRVERWVPNELIFQQVDAAVIHGGFSTTVGCLAHGIPPLVLGWFVDQGFYARRVADLGAGISLPFYKASIKALRSSIKELVDNGSYRNRAVSVQRGLGLLGGVKRASDLILELC